MKKTWRFVLKIVGLSLAAAGMICLIVGCWDKLWAGALSVKQALSDKFRNAVVPGEYEDYDDDQLL